MLSFYSNKFWNIGIQGKYVNNKTHSSFYSYKHCMKSVQIRSFFRFAFSHIQTEYGEIQSISPYSVQMRENTDQKKLRIWTLFTQWSFKIWVYIKNMCLVIHIVTFFSHKLANMGIQGIENSFFYLLLKSRPGSIFLKI